MSYQKESAQTTLDQIGKSTLAQLGASKFTYGHNFVQFSVKGKKFNKVVVEYDEVHDEYNLQLWKIDLDTEEYDSMTKLVKEMKGLYFDQLSDAIMGAI
jgi:hypothetical protein